MREKPFAITLGVGSSLVNKTGAWRTARPVYADRLPPCNDACPAGENIQRWLYHAEEGNYQAAWEQLVQDNPLPAVMGRVCYHPCQNACNRAQLDVAVGINSVERFLGDTAIEHGWALPRPAAETGRRVLVVGSGPSGLACAHHLRQAGHDVTVRDAQPRPGGMMRWAIPAYRLPRDVLYAEIARIEETGVRIELNRRVDDVVAARGEGFDAVFVAIGAQLSKRAYVPANESAKVLDALSVLSGVAGGEPPRLGRRVVVYGGGNTAMDVARSVRRLGAADAVVVYRRTRDRMPAQAFEVAEAEAEGVELRWLSTIAYAGNGVVKVEKMALDEQGHPQPTGEYEELEADSVVLAIGQEVDRSVAETIPGVEVVDGSVVVGPDMMTGCEGVFAGGDVVSAERTVTHAIGQGKRAARSIDAYLRGEPFQRQVKPAIATFDQLNTWYYSDAPATVRPQLEVARRLSGFDEVVGGLDESTALYEARRCLSCGNCFECDNCFGLCPDNAVIKLGAGQRFEINYEYCKGCGVCSTECPCGAIGMVAEEN